VALFDEGVPDESPAESAVDVVIMWFVFGGFVVIVAAGVVMDIVSFIAINVFVELW